MSFVRRAVDSILLRLENAIGPVLFLLARVFAKNGLPRSVFERIYRKPDPWRYLTSPYEQSKYETVLTEAKSAGTCDRVLEVGCSEGAFTEKLALRGIGRRIVGVDISAQAIERGRERLSRFRQVELYRMSILDEVPTGSFDLVFCMEVLYYLGRDLKQACARLGPVLASRCTIVLVHPLSIAHGLHESFRELLGLRLVSEHVEKSAARPYVVTVLERN